MKIEKLFTFDTFYPIERIGDPETTAFFDIETTGFSGDYNTVYLIGLIYFKNSAWQFVQYFAESLDTEPLILKDFFHDLKSFKTLVHFNGDTFDIPFLRKRAAAFGIDSSALDIESFDIYKKVKSYKKFLGLNGMRQKDIERALQVDRDDMMSGGELIEVYEHYLHTHSERDLKLLLLHNEDDLKGMPKILPILFVPDLMNASFTLTNYKLIERKNLFGENEFDLSMCFKSSSPCPVHLKQEKNPYILEAKNHDFRITACLLNGELKRFYKDYKNYYYLPLEDTAVHKSIGEFIDKDARTKASAKTCYTKVHGTFLPLPAPDENCIIKSDYSSKQCYQLFDEESFHSSMNADTFVLNLLNLLMRSR